MIEFLKEHIIDILEIVISIVTGFIGGATYTKIKSKNIAKIKGNNNSVNQKGN